MNAFRTIFQQGVYHKCSATDQTSYIEGGGDTCADCGQPLTETPEQAEDRRRRARQASRLFDTNREQFEESLIQKGDRI